MRKIIVAMRSDANSLAQLSDACDGFPATVQRCSHENNVTWFQFLLDTREDGRLVPKLNVCHVWQADSFVATPAETGSSYMYTIRLPRRPPKPPENVFAIAIEMDNTAKYETFLRSYHQLEQTTPAKSVPEQGSQVYIEVDIRSCNADQDVVHVREVLGDAHLFQQGKRAANIANDWPTPLVHIEYSDSAF